MLELQALEQVYGFSEMYTFVVTRTATQGARSEVEALMKFVKPEMHYIRCEGELTGEEMLQLSDEEPEEYLKRIGYEQAKKRYRIHPDFALREIAGEYAIVPLGETQFFTNAMMTPNKTATFLWQAFSEPSTEEDVVMRALERFDGAEADIRRDVEMFMKETMKRQALVEVD